jgi:phage-related protein
MGDSIIRSTESQWGNFANYLTNVFKTQYGLQSNIFSALTNQFTSMINNPQGYSQAALSGLKGGLVQNVATQFNNAKQNVQNNEAVQGSFGGNVKSGVNAQINGQLGAAAASTTASGLDQIEQQNEQLKIENQRIGMQGLMGVAQGENPQSFMSGATSAAGAVGSLGMDYFNTDQSGFGDVLGRSFANSFGGALGGASASGNALAGI